MTNRKFPICLSLTLFEAIFFTFSLHLSISLCPMTVQCAISCKRQILLSASLPCCPLNDPLKPTSSDDVFQRFPCFPLDLVTENTKFKKSRTAQVTE